MLLEVREDCGEFEGFGVVADAEVGVVFGGLQAGCVEGLGGGGGFVDEVGR